MSHAGTRPRHGKFIRSLRSNCPHSLGKIHVFHLPTAILQFQNYSFSTRDSIAGSKQTRSLALSLCTESTYSAITSLMNYGPAWHYSRTDFFSILQHSYWTLLVSGIITIRRWTVTESKVSSVWEISQALLKYRNADLKVTIPWTRSFPSQYLEYFVTYPYAHKYDLIRQKFFFFFFLIPASFINFYVRGEQFLVVLKKKYLINIKITLNQLCRVQTN